jgi:hypothetical protein
MRCEILEIPLWKCAVGLDGQPSLEPSTTEFVGHKRNEFPQLVVCPLIDLLPINEHASSSGGREFFSEFFGKGSLRCLVRNRQGLDSLGNPLGKARPLIS